MRIKEYFSNPELTSFDSAALFFKNEIGVGLGNFSKKPFSISKAIPNKNLHPIVSNVYLIGAVNENSFKKFENELFEENEPNYKYDGLLIFYCDLKIDNPTRTQLAELTRNLNRASNLLPVIALYKYGGRLCIATSERTNYKIKSKEGEKVGRVHLITDIIIDKVHAGHNKILSDLRKNVMDATSFDELYNKWYETFDVSILNKKFYQELANWYFWAMDNVQFPDDIEKKKDIRNATNLIRLITRIIFIWFIKEKKLVSDDLFRKDVLEKILVDFNKGKKSENYYLAILQNLFFGTLNQKMNERKFAERHEGFVKSDHGIRNVYRYPEKFAINENEVIKLFAEIPFLNGGLFDCLDKTDDKTKKDYFIDGFTRRSEKQAKVPDYLFFSEENEVDLNDFYGTKNKIYKVKGLINLLESYKFTVAENTPVEEEIALDPELLGKVFENLLASYNPETQTTARKQTGSFYTPREIVNYMVDESLIEYLKQHCVAIKDFDNRLRDLFSYTEKPNPFNKEDTKNLIEAINNCKILDPACGSGAFPMGVLHKMVHILKKLDSGNVLWRALQRQKALEKTEKAYKEDNKDEREKRLLEINDVFDNNASDYGRKLYLIENCIYGIDIQPIAVQIAKLRFFISLIIDQNKHEGKENFGIRSLPNLETKFVAANTLISLNKSISTKKGTVGTGFFKNLEIEKKENQLKELRHKYFTAKSRIEKIQFQEDDKVLRIQIANLLMNDGWEKRTADQLVSFDPYNQNIFTNWFDPEWMFGVTNGFEIVIGNPPYVDSETMTKNNPEFREYLKSSFQSAEGNWDLFVVFMEQGLKLCKNYGCLSFIVPNKLISAKYTYSLRSIICRLSPREIIDYSYVDVFKEVDVYPVVVLISNQKTYQYQVTTKVMSSLESVKTCNKLDSIQFTSDIYWDKYLFDLNVLNLIIKLTNNDKLRLKFPQILGAATVNEAYIIKEVLRELGREKLYFKFINTGTIDPYKTLWGNRQTQYIKGSYQKPILTKEDLVEINFTRSLQAASPKIIIAGMSLRIEAFFDEHGDYCAGKSTTIVIGEAKSLKTLTGILNSKVVSFWFSKYFNSLSMSGGYFNIGNNEIGLIPIPTFDIPNAKINSIVDKILLANYKNPSSDTTNMERQIDELVYKLYALTEEEISIIEGNK